VSERLDYVRARRPSSSGSRRLNDTFIIMRALTSHYISLFPGYSYFPYLFCLQRVIFVADNSHACESSTLIYIVCILTFLTSREIIIYCIFLIFNQFLLCIQVNWNCIFFCLSLITNKFRDFCWILQGNIYRFVIWFIKCKHWTFL